MNWIENREKGATIWFELDGPALEFLESQYIFPVYA